MATAKQLPSGTWRCRVYSHTDKDGKRIYMSFTASSKTRAEALASNWADNKNRSSGVGKTLETCIDEYIVAKTPVLSPSTIRSYRALQKKYYKELATKDVNKLTNYDVQKMLNNLKGQVSVKTIKNIYTLFTAAVKFHSKDITFNVTMPQPEVIENMEDVPELNEKEAPGNSEVQLLFRAASPWLKKCIALAAFSGMRRGEISALKYKNILPDQNKIVVFTAYAMDENNKWVLKRPKTEDSIRVVNVPKEVIALLGEGKPDDLIIGYNPNTISKMFNKLKNKMGVDITFHDLRHYYASIGNVLGVPDITLAAFGGWDKNSPVLKGIYQDKVKDISEGYAKKMNDYFSNLIKESMS